ncbi:universal stress protein [Thermosulfuriphilus ammonigenes]|uniref:Universal stress protein n=1 Tax=Thermosulfuriphilus ammonigenes TaxID=1936021 RepID=A0A6G7PV24_9BACT|nr:universal stress protein [Thermosulfuriphilus ammonigenes]MBA2848373.1 nucleotide-binding universal stress UspA family protein [Thermosulfuriphilus ammonigenes]QIJ71470.1 universal stress protein [Thermosulfuriphilus ammonigenes]
MKIERILFPVDFTSASTKVLPYALYLAEKLGAKLYILYVVEDLSRYTSIPVAHVSLASFEKELEEAAGKKMESFVEENLQGFSNYETHITKGDAAGEIVTFAKLHDIDLIVMATHGRKGLEKALFGSVTEKVLKISPVPVLTVNPEQVRS